MEDVGQGSLIELQKYMPKILEKSKPLINELISDG